MQPSRRTGRVRFRRSIGSGLLVVCAGLLATLFATGASAHKPTSHHSHHGHGRVHSQALTGSLRTAHVPVVTVKLKGGRGGGGDPGNDYPAVWRNARQDSMLDQWREYNRECTSFVAWALYSRNGFVMPFYDNANGWGPDAQRRGYVVNSTPAPGSVAWSNRGTYGHVAYVENVIGGNVYIEEYNEHYDGTYDSRTVPASTFTGYIHFKDQPPPASTPAPPAPITVTVAPPSTITPPTTTQPPTTTTTTTVTATSTTTSTTTTSTTTSTPPPPTTWAETTGGVTHTWTNYSNAGGTQGPSIASNQTVQIACRVQGFAVADGDTWWYRIASGPWNGTFYASADAFYNNGQTSGSLHGTPFVDPAVAGC
jgi:surface antigen